MTLPATTVSLPSTVLGATFLRFLHWWTPEQKAPHMILRQYYPSLAVS